MPRVMLQDSTYREFKLGKLSVRVRTRATLGRRDGKGAGSQVEGSEGWGLQK